jgi:small subunit ribosomal protein S16
MVRIRLRKVGLKNQPSYRIIAADKESPRDGRFLENLGHYNPRTEPSTVQIDEARLFHWLSHGAQPSDSVKKILNPLGTWDRWERYKAGEDLEDLLKEAKANVPEVDPRTRRDDLVSQKRSKKAAKKVEAPAEKEKPVEAEPKAEEVPVEEESPPAEIIEEDAEAEAVAEAVAEDVEPEAAVEEAIEEPAAEVEAQVESETIEETPEETGEETSEEETEEESKD